MKQLAILAAISAVLFAQTGFATEKKETGQGRRAQKMEEVRVQGVDLSKAILFRAGLTDTVLVHKYDERKNEWRFVGTKSASKES